MFNPTAVVIDAFVNELRKGYVSTYTNLEPDYPGIIDYVGHMFAEFEETGMNKKLGYTNSAALRAAYPKFFWSVVSPYVSDALSYLRMTQEGKLWVANLYSHIFAEEHNLPTLGAERIHD
jgi:hypothetical protein